MSHILQSSPSMKSTAVTANPSALAPAPGCVAQGGLIVGAPHLNKPINPHEQRQAMPPGGGHPSQGLVGGSQHTPIAANQMPGSAQPPANQNSAASSGTETDAGTAAIALDDVPLANTKEKTPMCLVNELARYNKISHQYTLMDEQGPAHKKTFFVKLKLEVEEYSAQGPSIKKGQHAAAEMALQETKYKHPPPKLVRTHRDMLGVGGYIVSSDAMELNTLAMKRGEAAIYKEIEHRNMHSYYHQPPSFDFRGMYNQRYHYPRMPKMYFVSLKVGQREFIGEGNTRQAARHTAAAKALRILRSLPMPNQDMKKEPAKEHADENNDGIDDLKSEISLVHEIALKRNFSVVFEVTHESGPAHMKSFVTKCIVGEFSVDAEGNSKKLSKKRAAEQMLEKLKQLPPLPVCIVRPQKKLQTVKKKSRNLIKVGVDPAQMQKADPNYGLTINPISRLIQIQQASKKREPVYTLVAERGLPRRREFVMQVAVDDQTCTGVGPNKKLAKRYAAEAMLQQLGYSRPSPQPGKPAIKSGPGIENIAADKKVTFMDPEGTATNSTVNGKAGRQLVPGLLLLPGHGKAHSSSSPLMGMGYTISQQQQMAIKAHQSTGYGRPEFQLREIARRHNFDVHFDDYAGTSSTECLSRVTLSTDPPHVLLGTGISQESARDSAAASALNKFIELGIIPPWEDGERKMAASGDGPQIKADRVDMMPQINPERVEMMANSMKASDSTVAS